MKDYLLNSLVLEPNMISTHAMLSTMYRVIGKPDSSLYYQEKVVKLLPNQANAYFSLGMSYAQIRYKDSLNLGAPHPKAVQNIEKAMAIDSSYRDLNGILAELYLGKIHLENGEDRDTAFNRFYPNVLACYEKLTPMYVVADSNIAKMGLKDYSGNNIFAHDAHAHNHKNGQYYALLKNYALLACFYEITGNAGKLEEYFSKFKNKLSLSGSFLTYWRAAADMYAIFEVNEDKKYLHHALDFLQEALKIADEAIKVSPDVDKPFISLHYQQLLTGIGSTYRALKNYEEAENYLKKAITYPILNSPATGHLKLVGGYGISFPNDIIQYTYPSLIAKVPNGEYHYRIEPNTEMVALKIESNKPEEALYWYEKAMQVSESEHGNDTMGLPYTKLGLKRYKNIDFKKFMAIREKYFPNAEKVD
jgi:tetratricopeptide (TPR) repeat protein